MDVRGDQRLQFFTDHLTAGVRGCVSHGTSGCQVALITFATEKMAPRFGDLFRHISFDQRICCNAYMKTMVKNEQPCSSRIFLAALVQIL